MGYKYLLLWCKSVNSLFHNGLVYNALPASLVVHYVTRIHWKPCIILDKPLLISKLVIACTFFQMCLCIITHNSTTLKKALCSDLKSDIKACRNGELHLRKSSQYDYGFNLILAILFANYAKIPALCCCVRLHNMKSIKSKIYSVVSKH